MPGAVEKDEREGGEVLGLAAVFGLVSSLFYVRRPSCQLAGFRRLGLEQHVELSSRKISMWRAIAARCKSLVSTAQLSREYLDYTISSSTTAANFSSVASRNLTARHGLGAAGFNIMLQYKKFRLALIMLHISVSHTAISSPTCPNGVAIDDGRWLDSWSRWHAAKERIRWWGGEFRSFLLV